jgi:hypothetical protein
MRTRSGIEFTGNLPFVFSSDGYFAMFSSTNFYSGTINDVTFYTNNGITHYLVNQPTTLAANETKTLEIILPFTAPTTYTITLNNMSGVELLSHRFIESRKKISVKLKNTTNTSVTGLVQAHITERIPVFS